MAKTKRKKGRATGESELRRHRARILFSLLGVCRNIERMQITPAARRACREVAALIDGALNEEIMAGPNATKALGKF